MYVAVETKGTGLMNFLFFYGKRALIVCHYINNVRAFG